MEEGVEVLIAATICEVSDHVPEAIVNAHHWKLLLLVSQAAATGPKRRSVCVCGTGTRGELRESCPVYRPL
jgi:hypothetical protein